MVLDPMREEAAAGGPMEGMERLEMVAPVEVEAVQDSTVSGM